MALICFVKTDHNEKDKNKQKKKRNKRSQSVAHQLFLLLPRFNAFKKQKNGQL